MNERPESGINVPVLVLSLVLCAAIGAWIWLRSGAGGEEPSPGAVGKETTAPASAVADASPDAVPDTAPDAAPDPLAGTTFEAAVRRGDRAEAIRLADALADPKNGGSEALALSAAAWATLLTDENPSDGGSGDTAEAAALAKQAMDAAREQSSDEADTRRAGCVLAVEETGDGGARIWRKWLANERAARPDDEALLMADALCASLENRYEDAQSAFGKLLDSDGTYRRAMYGEAECLYWLDSLEAAADAYEAMLRAYPDDAGALGGLGYSLVYLDRPEDASSAADRLLSLDGGTSESLLLKALTLKGLERHNECLEWLESAEEAGADPMDVAQYRAESLRALESYSESDAAWQQWADAGGSQGEADSEILWNAYLKGTGEAADDAAAGEAAATAKSGLEALLSADPELSRAEWMLGEICLDEGLNREAAAHYGRVTELDPGDMGARTSRWYALTEAGLYRVCLREVNRWLEEWPDSPTGLSYRADLLNRMGRPLSMVSDLMRLLRQDPSDGETMLNIGWTLCGWSSYGDAEAVLACFDRMHPEVSAESDADPMASSAAESDEDSMAASAAESDADSMASSAAESDADSMASSAAESDADSMASSAAELRETLRSFTGASLAERVQILLADRYLHAEKASRIDRLTSEIPEAQWNDAAAVAGWVERELSPDDPFTYAACGEDYQWMMKEEYGIGFVYRHWKDAVYVSFDSFSTDIGWRVVDRLAQETDTASMNLVIDLRGNGGGDLDACELLLDSLVGGGEMVTLTDRDGTEVWKTWSDADMIPFRHVYVWVDGYSASCSEVLALGLRQRLDNVTIVGETTYGKGVSQDMTCDAENEYLMLAVSSWWTIDGIGIHGTGLEPDVRVDGGASDYRLATKRLMYRAPAVAR